MPKNNDANNNSDPNVEIIISTGLTKEEAKKLREVEYVGITKMSCKAITDQDGIRRIQFHILEKCAFQGFQMVFTAEDFLNWSVDYIRSQFDKQCEEYESKKKDEAT